MKPQVPAHPASSENIPRLIRSLRDQRVIWDADLAGLYGIETRALNQAVRRNRDRFPADFFLQLTLEEKNEVITNCDHLARLRFAKALPLTFTEHGALMAAMVLSSPRKEIGFHVKEDPVPYRIRRHRR